MASINVEASRGCSSDGESMASSDCRVCLEPQAARLEKNIIELSFNEAMGYQVPNKLAATGSHGLHVEHLRSLDVDSAISKPTPHSTRGWKRVAREMGKSDQGTKGYSGLDTEGEKNDFGKCGTCMEIDLQIEGKK